MAVGIAFDNYLATHLPTASVLSFSKEGAPKTKSRMVFDQMVENNQRNTYLGFVQKVVWLRLSENDRITNHEPR